MSKNRNIATHPRGFTLLEVLIAAGIFGVIAAISTSLIVSTVQTEKKTDIRNAIYEDARILMEQLANYIQNNQIDYDEYYNIEVVEPKANKEIAYGLYHGVYGSRFYNPGDSLDGFDTKNPQDLGLECSLPLEPPEVAYDDCTIFYDLSQDFNTGQNPYDNGTNDADDANAFCDDFVDAGSCVGVSKTKNELYLINEDGDEKVIVALQNINNEDTAVGILEMEGVDIDQNGKTDLFRCKDGYECDSDGVFGEYFDDIDYPGIEDTEDLADYEISIAKQSDLGQTHAFSPFVPITPFRSNITRLDFIINPIEDPYKGYGEYDILTQPSVTIILGIEPSDAEKENYPGEAPGEILIQRTVSTGVTRAIETYPPTNEVDWICELLTGGAC